MEIIDWKKQAKGWENLLEARRKDSSKDIIDRHMEHLARALEKEYDKGDLQMALDFGKDVDKQQEEK